VQSACNGLDFWEFRHELLVYTPESEELHHKEIRIERNSSILAENDYRHRIESATRKSMMIDLASAAIEEIA
jgi:hypothetical protein